MHPFVKWYNLMFQASNRRYGDRRFDSYEKHLPLLFKDFLRHCNVTKITSFFISMARTRTRSSQKVQRCARPMAYNIKQLFCYSRSHRKQKKSRWKRQEIWPLFLRFSKCACVRFVYYCEPMRMRVGTIGKLKRLLFQIYTCHRIRWADRAAE